MPVYSAYLCGLDTQARLDVRIKSRDGRSPIEVYDFGRVLPDDVGIHRIRGFIAPTSDESIAIDYIRGFYKTPDPSIYSIKPGLHEEIWIEAHGRRASVDLSIAEVIKAIWACGWETMGSCEAHPKSGRAYVSFPVARQGIAFADALERAEIPCDVKNKFNHYPASSICDEIDCRLQLPSVHVLFDRADFPRIVSVLLDMARKHDVRTPHD